MAVKLLSEFQELCLSFNPAEGLYILKGDGSPTGRHYNTIKQASDLEATIRKDGRFTATTLHVSRKTQEGITDYREAKARQYTKGLTQAAHRRT